MAKAKKPTRHPNNRVWIELDPPVDADHAKEICERVNRMLQRLAEDPNEHRSVFSWSERDQHYIIIDSQYQTYQVCVDNGHWFNLDYLGRELASNP